MMTLDFNINYSVKDFCKEVLVNRFPGEPTRQEINENGTDKLNFCCPFCGDSKVDRNKKRGNLYLNTETYKCYNDGCEVQMPLEKFVSRLGLKYGIAIPNIKKAAVFTVLTSPKKRGFILEFLLTHQSRENLLSLEETVERFRLTRCSDAPEGSRVYEYVNKRMLFDLPMFERTCYYDSIQNKIYIFNVDLKSDKIIGFALRYIIDQPSGLKYNIKNYSELEKTGLVKGMDVEFIEKINSLNNYFNILNLDFTKDITVTEGQFDSLFIENCTATTGVTKSKKMLDDLTQKQKTRILFDNDEAGLSHSIELLKKGYRVFMWASVIQTLKKKYIHQNIQIKTIKDINDLFIFMKRMDPELDYLKFNQFINQYFTSSHFDMLLL
jgi:hypothetical protein